MVLVLLIVLVLVHRLASLCFMLVQVHLYRVWLVSFYSGGRWTVRQRGMWAEVSTSDLMI